MRKFWTLAVLTAMLVFFVPFSASASTAADNFTATIVRNCADNSFDVTWNPSFVTGFGATISTTSGGSPVLEFGSNPTTGSAHFEPGPYYDTIVLNVTFGDGDTTVRSFGALLATCGKGVTVGGGGSVDPDPIVVTPESPVLVNPGVCGVAFTVTIPSMDGVVYEKDQFATIVTITATAVDGYVIADGAEVRWDFDTTATECPSTDPTPDDPGKAGPTPTPDASVTPTPPAGGDNDGEDDGGAVDDGTDDGTTGGNTGGTDTSGGDASTGGNTGGVDTSTSGTTASTGTAASTGTGTSNSASTGVTDLPTAGSGPSGSSVLVWAAVAVAFVFGAAGGGIKWHERRTA